MKIVTSGSRYLDIDAYGGCIAYAELLQKQGTNARAVSSAPLNESITPTIHAWGSPLISQYEASTEDEFILIDVSDSKFFDHFVDKTRVTGVIDHHPGFEAEWAAKLGAAANIEFIGAACTLVYEEWVKAQKLDEMSVLSARLLATGILDNTLNFKADVTTDRDHTAYQELRQRADLPQDWPAQYFTECQESIMADIESALRNDTKVIEDSLPLPVALGQLVIWDAAELLREQRTIIAATMQALNADWAVNVVSIAEGTSYFLAANPLTQAKLSKLLTIEFKDGIAQAHRLWLRKEILKRAQSTKVSQG